MGWSDKYKKSIDCNNPKGFSQRAHCQGKKKKMKEESNPRIPRKKGQPANSKKHSDLYTDENPKGTIHGLGFKDVATAKASVTKIKIQVDPMLIKSKQQCYGTKSKRNGKNC